jgi:site-specific recombinase XerD
VFLSPRGKGWTVDGFESTWRRLRQREQLPADLVPYLCRHRFGTELVRSGTPIESVKDLMGHANIATTLGYVHRSVAELASKQDLVPDLPSAIDESLRPADSCPPRTDGPPDEVLPAAA